MCILQKGKKFRWLFSFSSESLLLCQYCLNSSHLIIVQVLSHHTQSVILHVYEYWPFTEFNQYFSSSFIALACNFVCFLITPGDNLSLAEDFINMTVNENLSQYLGK